MLKAVVVIAWRRVTVVLTWHCLCFYEYDCEESYKKLPWTLRNNRLALKFSEPWNFMDSFFTIMSKPTSFGGSEFVIKYFINNSHFYRFRRLDGSTRVSEIKWWMFQVISLWIERVIVSYIFKNIDFRPMQKRRFLMFISTTICRIKKFQIRKRCTSPRRIITYFLFRIFMHFDILLIIGKVLSSSSVASNYSIRALNLPIL